jgi:succinylglutamic semialdehyde dehydrogenase
MIMMLKGDYFNGQFTHPDGIKNVSSSDTVKKKSPAKTAEVIWEAPLFNDHVDHVIESAVHGFKTWKKTSIEERISFLRRYQTEIKKRSDDIAMAIALEVGKPLWEAKTEAASVAAKVDVTINDSLPRIMNKKIDEVMPKITGHVIYKPIGPSLVIGPFNFPCHLANGQILSALLAGNSIVFKPSEKTIYSSQILIECFHAAGMPKGVINFINGTGAISSKLTSDKRLRAIFFTGSRAVGLKILENTHRDLGKMVALELGGKNTSIIHHDAHLDHALPELLRACFLTSGQRCTSTSIILVQRKIEAEFIERFKKLTEKIIVGSPLQTTPTPFMGPLIDEAAMKLYFDYCQLAKTEGAEELIKPQHLNEEGNFCSPSIHYMKTPKLKGKFYQEEIFGPNCCIIPYDTIEEAIHMSNATDYGLAAAIFTRDTNLYHQCVQEIDSGLLNLNRSTVGATARLPFGGVKDSGNFHPAAVSMIDHCVTSLASLETLDDTSSKISDIVGLKE